VQAALGGEGKGANHAPDGRKLRPSRAGWQGNAATGNAALAHGTPTGVSGVQPIMWQIQEGK